MTGEPICDPPCTGNKVCQNYTGDPDCVCVDGFSGEDNCTGILDYRITTVIFLIIQITGWSLRNNETLFQGLLKNLVVIT